MWNVWLKPKFVQNTSKIYQCFCNNFTRSKSSKSSTYVVEPTTMKIQKFNPSEQLMKGVPLYVSRYSTKGFTVQGNKVFGSLAIVPKSFYSWRVSKPEDITKESLQLFTILEPRIEILVIGTGDRVAMLDPTVRQYLRKHNISVEVLDTPNACSTYNFLLEEERVTGALLIPPNQISF